MKVPLMYSPNFSLYDFGPSHPFNPSRFDEFPYFLRERGLELDIISSDRAPWKDIESVHDTEYLKSLRMLAKVGGMVSPDTPVSSSLIEAARYMVGAALKGIETAMEKGGNVITMGGFHHAGPDYGEGFCIINDVAIAAKHAGDKGKKVLILDMDAHQGNGTMDIFWNDPEVLFISIHQDPRTIYPGRGFIDDIGAGDGEGFTVNIPMPRYSVDEQYEKTLRSIALPIAEQFNPDVIVTNGGSDPHFADRLTDLGLTLRGLNFLGSFAREIAGGKPMLNMLISGYGRMVLPGWYAIATGASGLEWKADEESFNDTADWVNRERLNRDVDEIISALRRTLMPYWDI